MIQPIGIIHSPHRESVGTPIQAALASGVQGSAEIFSDYETGLSDLAGFDRIWLIYWFHRARVPEMLVTPYLDKNKRGLFSTRAPSRPNPIGISSVRLLKIIGCTLEVDGLDVLDNTPLLDIKPYVPAFDAFQANRIGWCAQAPDTTAADGRFQAPTT